MAWHSAVYRHQQNHKQSASWILLACSQLASILSIVWYLETAKETQIRFLSAKCILFMYQCVVINGLDGSKFSQLQTVTTTIFRLCWVALRDSDIKRETEASINIYCGPGHGLKKTHKKTNKEMMSNQKTCLKYHVWLWYNFRSIKSFQNTLTKKECKIYQHLIFKLKEIFRNLEIALISLLNYMIYSIGRLNLCNNSTTVRKLP